MNRKENSAMTIIGKGGTDHLFFRIKTKAPTMERAEEIFEDIVEFILEDMKEWGVSLLSQPDKGFLKQYFFYTDLLFLPCDHTEGGIIRARIRESHRKAKRRIYG